MDDSLNRNRTLRLHEEWKTNEKQKVKAQITSITDFGRSSWDVPETLRSVALRETFNVNDVETHGGLTGKSFSVKAVAQTGCLSLEK